MVPESQRLSASKSLSHGTDHGFALTHQVPIIAFNAIPLEDRKLRRVLASPFSFPPAPTDLEDSVIPGSQKPFHAELGRRMEEPVSGRDRIDVRFRSGSGNAMRGFDLKVTVVDEETPDGLDDLCSCS